MKATEQYFPVVLFVMLLGDSNFLSHWTKSYRLTFQVKATNQSFPVVMFVLKHCAKWNWKFSAIFEFSWGTHTFKAATLIGLIFRKKSTEQVFRTIPEMTSNEMKFHKDLQWMTHIQNSSLLILNLERSEIFHALKGPTFNIGATQHRLDTNVMSANAFLCIRTEPIRYTLCRYKPYLGGCRNMKAGTKEIRKGRTKDS